MDETEGPSTDAVTYVVISIHVAHRSRKLLLPCPISTLAQVREALVRLSSELSSTQKPSFSLSYLELLDVIWSPMLPTETITRKDLFARYPELRAIES
jgi:uncharacterized membrane protein